MFSCRNQGIAVQAADDAFCVADGLGSVGLRVFFAARRKADAAAAHQAGFFFFVHFGTAAACFGCFKDDIVFCREDGMVVCNDIAAGNGNIAS